MSKELTNDESQRKAPTGGAHDVPLHARRPRPWLLSSNNHWIVRDHRCFVLSGGPDIRRTTVSAATHLGAGSIQQTMEFPDCQLLRLERLSRILAPSSAHRPSPNIAVEMLPASVLSARPHPAPPTETEARGSAESTPGSATEFIFGVAVPVRRKRSSWIAFSSGRRTPQNPVTLWRRLGQGLGRCRQGLIDEGLGDAENTATRFTASAQINDSRSPGIVKATVARGRFRPTPKLT